MSEAVAAPVVGGSTSDERGRLLIVDDNEDNRDMLSRRLARRGYAVEVAVDGSAALALVAEQVYDLIVLDVMMPGIDGFEVLERIRRTHSVAELPVIMATARDRSDDIVRALELGANDYVTKPLDFAVVLARVRTQLALHDARRELAKANARMRRDLDAGAKIQRALVPSGFRADGLEVAARFEPCSELGGDLLDVFRLDDSTVGLYLLDVSGHGVPAALTSVTLSRLMSHMGADSLVFEEGSAGARLVAPASFAASLNRRFPMDPASSQYFTLVYAVLDPKSSVLRYVAAGHPGPVRVNAQGEAQSFDSTGPAIGWFPEARFEECVVPVSTGDRFYFYSDGIVEAQNSDGEFFGVERLLEMLTLSHSRSIEQALAALETEVRAWCGPAGPGDDVSMLALEIAGLG